MSTETVNELKMELRESVGGFINRAEFIFRDINITKGTDKLDQLINKVLYRENKWVAFLRGLEDYKARMEREGTHPEWSEMCNIIRKDDKVEPGTDQPLKLNSSQSESNKYGSIREQTIYQSTIHRKVNRTPETKNFKKSEGINAIIAKKKDIDSPSALKVKEVNLNNFNVEAGEQDSGSLAMYVRVGNQWVHALIDTGCNISLINPKYTRKKFKGIKTSARIKVPAGKDAKDYKEYMSN
ncbi:hypothetical protein DICPUDRAFT_77839 [Dictyostelium purpureum]|uniref:Peptidase A2 domain-containing protein n=1 Tax=Dictyostelium purpureum TaxID=5786 RepID=F0ZHS3_DICPU|nr:uncharacterized protein DICPUDRAFT_77839 [Dictyostelium purpureum]EGC36524.1 hypothetical protein DICPUDRAFT_77839 [Dictyostelium purpureum]|eukprot:XP_003286969.1 hypothetical protein DICPUDRAFT_77839 [Dictyostelium purpureum]